MKNTNYNEIEDRWNNDLGRVKISGDSKPVYI